MKVTTKGYGGAKYNKAVHATTNDPSHQEITFEITGEVKNFADIIPRSVYLNGKAGELISKSVKIIPQTENPFKIVKITALNGLELRYSLKESELDGKKIYELTIENTKQTPGQYSDTISLITDKSDQTPLTIYVRGNIHDPSEENTGESGKVQQPESPVKEGPGASVKVK